MIYLSHISEAELETSADAVICGWWKQTRDEDRQVGPDKHETFTESTPPEMVCLVLSFRESFRVFSASFALWMTSRETPNTQTNSFPCPAS